MAKTISDVKECARVIVMVGTMENNLTKKPHHESQKMQEGDLFAAQMEQKIETQKEFRLAPAQCSFPLKGMYATESHHEKGNPL